MSTETIPIVTSKEKFFLEYLTLKRPVIDSILTKLNRKKTTLSDTPLKVLAQLLYYNDVYKDQPEEQRWNMVFSKEIRQSMFEALDLKEHHLNNYISHLRTIKIIDGKKVRKMFTVYADDQVELSFTFRLNGHT